MLLHITSHVIKFILFKYVPIPLFGYFIQNKYICRNIFNSYVRIKGLFRQTEVVQTDVWQ